MTRFKLAKSLVEHAAPATPRLARGPSAVRSDLAARVLRTITVSPQVAGGRHGVTKTAGGLLSSTTLHHRLHGLSALGAARGRGASPNLGQAIQRAMNGADAKSAEQLLKVQQDALALMNGQGINVNVKNLDPQSRFSQ